MALRKEPGRRYATVEHFSDDIRRYLEGVPVQARKDTLAYRTGKFIRRNKWAVVAAVGAATVLSFAILAEYFPKQLAGRANGALNLFHIAAAFVVQYSTGVVLQHWTPQAGHYPEIAYQTAFALNLAFQVVAWIWFMFPRVRIDSRQKLTREPCSDLRPGRR